MLMDALQDVCLFLSLSIVICARCEGHEIPTPTESTNTRDTCVNAFAEHQLSAIANTHAPTHARCSCSCYRMFPVLPMFFFLALVFSLFSPSHIQTGGDHHGASEAAL